MGQGSWDSQVGWEVHEGQEGQAWMRVSLLAYGESRAPQRDLWLRVALGLWGQGRRDSARGPSKREGQVQARFPKFKGCREIGEV